MFLHHITVCLSNQQTAQKPPYQFFLGTYERKKTCNKSLSKNGSALRRHLTCHLNNFLLGGGVVGINSTKTTIPKTAEKSTETMKQESAQISIMPQLLRHWGRVDRGD